MKARSIVRELERDTSDTYYLYGAEVLGKLDLRHRVIKRPIEIHGCEFRGEIDLRYCEFEQVVVFSGCTFHDTFNSGDETESYAIYRKDFICASKDNHKARFLGVATFNGIRVEGTANFKGAHFELPNQAESSELGSTDEYEVDFRTAVIGGELNCMDAVFEATVSFNGIKCGTYANFENARFQNQGKAVDFITASIGHQFICKQAVFEGPASFNSITCSNTAFFDHARFISQDEVNFRFSSFGLNLRLWNTDFCGDVDFRSMECANLYCNEEASPNKPAIFRKKVDFKVVNCKNLGFFRGVTFGGEVDFRYARIGGELDFRGACFEEKLRLREIHIAQSLRCNRAKFKGEVDALGVTCNNLWASDVNDRSESRNEPSEGADFRQNVDLRQLTCHKLVFFRSATFGGEVDLRFARIGGDLDFRYAYSAKRLRLGETQISQKLRFSGSCFKGELELYGMEIQILELMEANPIDGNSNKVRDPSGPEADLKDIPNNQGDSLAGSVFPFYGRGLNLTGTTFKRFHGGLDSKSEKELSDKLVEAQDHTKFTRNPHLQLENHYRNIGDEQRARELHLKGIWDFRQRNLSRYTWRQNPWRKWWDGLFFHLVYYGHKPHRPLYYLLALLLITAAFLWASPGALCSQNPEEPPPRSSQRGEAAIDSVLNFKQCQPKDGVSLNPSRNLWHGLLYSLTLVVPVIQFAFTRQWVPNPRYPILEMVATAQILVGWVVVLLAIAAWTGLVKK